MSLCLCVRFIEGADGLDFAEIIILSISGLFTYWFLSEWYSRIINAWLPKRNKEARIVLGALPVLSLVIILYTLRILASFDVVDDFIFIIFYVLIGYAWLRAGMFAMFRLFDISWIDDVLDLNNGAALFTIIGSFLGLTVIYAGANVGDGPGWWCVFFAGGLGVSAWFVLIFSADRLNHVFERISVERDLGCGLRVGAYMLAAGIILGRASAGDWTSFPKTIAEFADGWPVLIFAVFQALIERYYINRLKADPRAGHSGIYSSVFWAAAFIIAAIISVELLPPLPINPYYKVSAPIFTFGAFL